jgi:hypothetical protein
MYVVFLVKIGYHQPKMADKVVIMTIVAGAIWGSDRLSDFGGFPGRTTATTTEQQ